MNNKFFATLICITVLTFAPACKKQSKASSRQDELNTMIEIDTEVFETEETTENEKSIVKF